MADNEELTNRDAFENIDITNDYMFSTVMQDPQLCIGLLELLLPGKKIQSVEYIRFDEDEPEADYKEAKAQVQTQRAMNAYLGYRGVRLDVYVDDGKTSYNVEMQTTNDRALAKRCRYYQSNIDLSLLKRGQTYDRLGECYVIFICKFDPFGLGYYRYSFRNSCDQEYNLKLNDGAYKLFFNTGGTVDNVPHRTLELLRYMNNTRGFDVEKSDSELIHRIDDAVNMTKMSQEWRDAYMIYQVKQREAELRGEARGEARGISIGEARGKSEMALKMIERGYSVDEISLISGLSLADINALNKAHEPE